MKSDPDHRYYLSTKRRIERFTRYMRERFPAERNNGVPWYECIDTSKLDARDTALCIFSQLANTAFFPQALQVLNVPSTNMELRHIGVMPYCRSDMATARGLHEIERQRLNAAFKELIERLQTENRSETRRFVAGIVQSASART